MGLPIDLFTDSPDPNLLCPICQDVLDNPSSLQCGHLFCRSCLLSYQQEKQQSNNGNGNGNGNGRKYNFKGVSIVCPTCRHLAVIEEDVNGTSPGSSHTTNPIVKSIIENMQIVCKNQFEREEQLHLQGEGQGVVCNNNNTNKRAAAAAAIECCTWKGKLCDYKAHADTTCQLQLVTCKASDCNVRLTRGCMRSGGYCNETQCAISLARRLAAGRWADLMLLEKETLHLKEDVASLGSGNGSGNGSVNTKISDKENIDGNSNRALLNGDKIVLSKGIKDSNNENEHANEPSSEMSPLARPSFGVRKSLHDKSLMSPRPWVVKTTNINSTNPSTLNSKKVDWNINDKLASKETGDTTKKDIPSSSCLDTIKTSNRQLLPPPNNNENNQSNDGNNAAFVMAAVKILVEKEMSKHRQQQQDAHRKNSAIIEKERPSHDSIRAMFVHRYLMDFCRSWIRHKPEALHEFAIYRPKIDHSSSSSCNNNSNHNNSISRLLCGIPGPKRTRWDGGLFPILIEWNDVDMPPQCRFPRDFHHANVLPSGLVSLSTFKDDWHPEISIPEILFDLQQLLAHPNHEDPAQPDARASYRDGTYDYKTMIQTSLYNDVPTSLLDMASGIDGFGAAARYWQLVDGEVLSGRSNVQNNPLLLRPPREPSFASSRVGNKRNAYCRSHCSCCAWGQTLWDSKGQMRYLFGKGGSY